MHIHEQLTSLRRCVIISVDTLMTINKIMSMFATTSLVFIISHYPFLSYALLLTIDDDVSEDIIDCSNE